MAPRGVTRDKVFRFVRDRLLRGMPPTVREVQHAMGFKAVQTARQHLEALVETGRLLKSAGKSRSYRLPALNTASFIPLLGSVQAGALTEAIEDLEGYIPIHGQGSGELFALRVRGESMRDAGILPGDVVVVRRQPTAENGQIIVALVEDEATVKTLRKVGRSIELLPANPDFSPIRPDPASLSILGKVIEVRRYLEGSPFGSCP